MLLAPSLPGGKTGMREALQVRRVLMFGDDNGVMQD
jgi:hypothetical protein